MAYRNRLEVNRSRNKSCFVYGCFSTAANKPKLGFHKFPTKEKRNITIVKKNGDNCLYDRRQLWIDALNINKSAAEALDQNKNIYVCSLHFARQDFYYNQDITGQRYLKEFAIPRRNLPARKTSPLTTKFIVRPLNRVKSRGYFNIHNPDGRKVTAPRSSLGASKHNDPSYTKTVWVVRKPTTSTIQNEGNRSEDTTNVTVAETFSLQDSQVDFEKEMEDDEQFTNLVNEYTSPESPDTQWLNSELTIKEEPISDSEQEPSNALLSKGEDESQVAMGRNINEDNEPSYEDSVFIEGEDEEGNLTIAAKKLSKTTREYDHSDGEDSDLTSDNEDEQLRMKEPEITILEGYDSADKEEHQIYGQYTPGVNASDSDEDEYLQEEYLEPDFCNECGEENCETHHKICESDTEDTYFVCLVCSLVFSSQNELAIHSRCHMEVSEEEYQQDIDKSLTCGICGRVLSTKATLREHVMIHTGEKPHKCLLCGKSFRHKANLVVHVNSHAVVSTYKCKKCNKAFTKKIDFEKHLKVHVDSSGNPLVCKLCNAVFKSQRTLYNHSLLHTKNGLVRTKSKKGKNPQFPCKLCGRCLSTKATLKEHMMIHSGEKPHVCKICGRCIRHKANYIVHVQTHGQGKSFECDMCDEAFMRKTDLTQHKQLEHSKSKLLRCPICSEVFKSPQKFNRHMEIHESVSYMNETEDIPGIKYSEDDEWD